ncbi:uncharacterized protein LOC142328408 [Lycorma delicatula]|uniref:uncharacterized protein LOC142328408 n=1 Tax=Lycorma delicatula TaxID=130591 RepID=UPI003F50EFF8
MVLDLKNNNTKDPKAEVFAKWLQTQWMFQQQRFVEMGDRLWDKLDLDQLNEKVQFALKVAMPEDEKLDSLKEKIVNKIKSYSKCEYYYFGCTFISCLTKSDLQEFKFVVFRTSLDVNYDSDNNYYTTGLSDSFILIDMHCRQYESWSDFLSNNKLPKCMIMYPQNGLYKGTDSLEVICEMSVACSLKSIIKNGLDFGVNFAAVCSAGVLICNPVGAGTLIAAGAISSVSGLYALGSGVSKLHDIEKHEGGIDFKDSKTNLVVAEMLISGVGGCAVGAAAAFKGIKVGTVIVEGSEAYKLANNMSKIARVYCGANVGLYGTIAFYQYKNNGKLDYSAISKMLLFSFNCVVSESTLKYIISRCKLDVEIIIDNIISHKIRNFLKVQDVTKFLENSVDDFNRLLEIFLPDFPVNFKDLTEMHRCGCLIVKLTKQAINKEIDKLDYIYKVHLELKSLNKILVSSIDHVKQCMIKKFGNEMLKCLQTSKWMVNQRNNFSFEFNIVGLLELEKLTKTSVIRYSTHCNDENILTRRQRLLFYKIFEMIKKYQVYDFHHAVCKFEYYCKYFDVESRNIKYDMYFKAFTYSVCHETTQDAYFNDKHNVKKENISQFIFEKSLDCMLQKIQYINKEFENEFIQEKESNRAGQFYRFVIKKELEQRNENDIITEEEIYKQINLIPLLSEIHPKNSTCTFLFGDMAIIESSSDILYFYTETDGFNLNGVILHDRKEISLIDVP